MTTKTNTFSFAGLELRSVFTGGKIEFHSADVCRYLGFREHPQSGFNNTLRRLPAGERRVLQKAHTTDMGAFFPGRTSQVTLITEAGLYALVMRSDKPQAKEFQTWVTGTVLPAIRQTGGYIKGEEKLATGEMDYAPRMPFPLGGIEHQRPSAFFGYLCSPGGRTAVLGDTPPSSHGTGKTTEGRPWAERRQTANLGSVNPIRNSDLSPF